MKFSISKYKNLDPESRATKHLIDLGLSNDEILELKTYELQTKGFYRHPPNPPKNIQDVYKKIYNEKWKWHRDLDDEKLNSIQIICAIVNDLINPKNDSLKEWINGTWPKYIQG